MPYVKYLKPVLTKNRNLKTTKDGRFCLFVDTRSKYIIVMNNYYYYNITSYLKSTVVLNELF